MTTAFKVVQDALVSALLTPPTIVGSRVVAGRDRPMPAEHESDIAVSVESMTGQADLAGDAPVGWDIVYLVEIRCRGSVAVDAVAALDPLLEAAYARVLAVTPPAGVTSWMLAPRARVDVDEAATPIASAQLALIVHLRTQHGSLVLAT